LRYGYIIKCERLDKDASDNVTTIYASYDPATKSGTAGGRNVKGAIHWVSKSHGFQCQVRLYDRLFTVENPDDGDGDYKDFINPKSLVEVTAWCEPSLRTAKIDESYQFERNGYFTPDRIDSTPDALVFNRAVTLKDGWKPS
jgi:glutaminyl-tRNA synthetase